jgi:hypothetical protein
LRYTGGQTFLKIVTLLLHFLKLDVQELNIGLMLKQSHHTVGKVIKH